MGPFKSDKLKKNPGGTQLFLIICDWLSRHAKTIKTFTKSYVF